MLLSACTNDTLPSPNCDNAKVEVRPAGGQETIPLRLFSSTLLRTGNSTGSIKLLSLEAYSDSVKIVMNIADGVYRNAAQLQSDSLGLKTYSYARKAGSDTTGRVLFGIKNGQAFNIYITDSSAVTLTEVDRNAHTVSGRYYLQTISPALKIEGSFSKACFLSLP